MKAFLKNYRQSPRKVRLLAGLVKGQTVSQALAQLDVAGKRAAWPLKNLIKSAVANASHNFQLTADELVIKDMRVDKGITLRRSQPTARGSAHLIRKRSSHVSVVLARPEEMKVEKKVGKKEIVAPVKVETSALKTKKEVKAVPKSKSALKTSPRATKKPTS